MTRVVCRTMRRRECKSFITSVTSANHSSQVLRELSCVIPRVKSSGLTSFMYQGVCHWNKLPLEIKQCPSKDTFKYQVKCVFYIIVYLRRKPVYMYVLNCIDRMFFACMLSDDGKLIICIGPHWK